jgi:leucyl-tRNA synthetase
VPQKFREKYRITDEMVLPFEPVPIIEVPGHGNMIAVTLCEQVGPPVHARLCGASVAALTLVSFQLGVKSQNDAAHLTEAKDIAYRQGFYSGQMIVGAHAGESVQVRPATPVQPFSTAAGRGAREGANDRGAPAPLLQVAKPKIQGELMAAGQAIKYMEPEKEVTSRSGDDCVVALTDQWSVPDCGCSEQVEPGRGHPGSSGGGEKSG